MNIGTDPSQPDARAEALVAAYRARRLSPRRARDPAAGRAVPRPLRRGHPQAHVSSPPTRTAASCACGRTSPSRCRCDYLASPQAGAAAGLLLSRPGVPRPRRRRRRSSCRPASSRSAGPTRRRPTPRCWRSASRPTAHYGVAGAGNPHGRRRAVRRADRGARSRAGLEAPAGEGFQPQDLARARPRRAHAHAPPTRSRNIRACSRRSPAPIRRRAHALVTDLLSIAGITAVGGRSVGEIAERFLEQAALGAANTLPRETRALIERFLAIAGDPDEAAAELRALAAEAEHRRSAPRSTCSRAAPASSPRAASMSRASSSRPRSAAASTTTPASCSSCTTPAGARPARWSPAAATTACSRGSARKSPIPAVGFAVWIERLAAFGGAP